MKKYYCPTCKKFKSRFQIKRIDYPYDYCYCKRCYKKVMETEDFLLELNEIKEMMKDGRLSEQIVADLVNKCGIRNENNDIDVEQPLYYEDFENKIEVLAMFKGHSTPASSFVLGHKYLIKLELDGNFFSVKLSNKDFTRVTYINLSDVNKEWKVLWRES